MIVNITDLIHSKTDLDNVELIPGKEILPGDRLIVGEDGKIRLREERDGFKAGFTYNPKFMRIKGDVLIIDTFSPYFYEFITE